MKYVVVLCDGMADLPIEELDGKTPMQAAKKPFMDEMAKTAEVGLVKTVADGLKPGSDVANLSVMGFDPMKCYTGRSPLEAASIGINMSDTDIAIRCNLVTLSEDEPYEEKTIIDYCAGDISTKEADELIKSVEQALGNDIFAFYTGVSYRHCLIWHGGNKDGYFLTPPHDITGKVITDYICREEAAAPLIDLMKKSFAVLRNHPVNKARVARGERPANSIWLWGQGSKPSLESFYGKFGKKGAVISAVDLIKGIGKCADMDVIDVSGATGYIDTNFDGKAEAAINAIKNGADLAYIHIEAPDECGHRRERDNKVRSIELIDEKIVGRVLSELKGEDLCVLICPDHPTPLSIATHSSDAVPYMIWRSDKKLGENCCFCEKSARKSGNYIDFGPSLMTKFLDAGKN